MSSAARAKAMKVDAICTGTVIDHIRPGQALRVVELLRLPEEPVMTIGQNLTSGKHGSKDLVKIEGHELSQSEVDTVAIIAPEATSPAARQKAAVHACFTAAPFLFSVLRESLSRVWLRTNQSGRRPVKTAGSPAA